MRSAFWLLVCGCSQAPQYTPPPSNGSLASAVMIGPTSGSQTIPIAPTHEGDRIDVTLTGTAYVHDIAAGSATVYPLIAVSGPCPHPLLTWLCSGVAAGTDSKEWGTYSLALH